METAARSELIFFARMFPSTNTLHCVLGKLGDLQNKGTYFLWNCVPNTGLLKLGHGTFKRNNVTTFDAMIRKLVDSLR